jgi:hypothetical protein
MIDLDAIRARYKEACYFASDIGELLCYVDELRAAAGKVTCETCSGTGNAGNELVGDEDCPDCADLRLLLAKEGT